MEQSSTFMWTRRKAATGGLHHLPPFSAAPSAAAASHGYSWEEQAFAQDSAGRFGGCVWPPRSYSCSFCKREFRSAQALGGHMNVHRRDRARLKMSPTSSLEGTHLQPNDQVFALVHNDGRMIPRAPHGTAASPLISSPRVSLAFAQKSSGEQILVSTSTSNSAALVKENSQEHPAAFSVPFSFSDQFSLRLLSSSKQKLGKENISLQVKERVDRGEEIRDVGEEGDEVFVEGIRRKRRRINDAEIPFILRTIPCEEDKINIPLPCKVITGTNNLNPDDQELDLELRL